jgi:hypothetical protein
VQQSVTQPERPTAGRPLVGSSFPSSALLQATVRRAQWWSSAASTPRISRAGENTKPDAIQVEQTDIDEGVLETLNRANGSVETTNYGTLLDEYVSTLDSHNTSIKRDAGANGDT